MTLVMHFDIYLSYDLISLFALLTGGMVITGMVIARMEAIKKVKRKYA